MRVLSFLAVRNGCCDGSQHTYAEEVRGIGELRQIGWPPGEEITGSDAHVASRSREALGSGVERIRFVPSSPFVHPTPVNHY